MRDLTTAAPKHFLDAYSNYVTNILAPTQEEAKRIFDRWRDPLYWAQYAEKTRLPAPSPIQRVHTRIKRPESVIDKVMRKAASFPKGLTPETLQTMTDALGVRIVVYFLTSLPLVDHELRHGHDFEISPDFTPVAYVKDGAPAPPEMQHLRTEPKASGYTSVHYILRLRESSIPEEERPWFELQVRTMVEDVWAEVEHLLGYKPEKRTSFAVRKQFQILSTLLQSVDEHFSFLYEELTRFQKEITYKENDLLNAENLPPVLAELGIGCSQREIDGMLKILVSRGIEIVGNLIQRASVKRIELIKNTYRSCEGREPKNFELVACIAITSNLPEGDALVEFVRAQISFLKAWDALKDDLGERRSVT